MNNLLSRHAKRCEIKRDLTRYIAQSEASRDIYYFFYIALNLFDAIEKKQQANVVSALV